MGWRGDLALYIYVHMYIIVVEAHFASNHESWENR